MVLDLCWLIRSNSSMQQNNTEIKFSPVIHIMSLGMGWQINIPLYIKLLSLVMQILIYGAKYWYFKTLIKPSRCSAKQIALTYQSLHHDPFCSQCVCVCVCVWQEALDIVYFSSCLILGNWHHNVVIVVQVPCLFRGVSYSSVRQTLWCIISYVIMYLLLQKRCIMII